MENFNKTLPFLTTIIGFGILVFAFAIFSFINGVKTELNTRMDRVETKIHDVRTELKTDIQNVKTELNARMDRVESRMEGIEDKLDQLILLQAQSMQSMPAPKVRRIGPKKVKRKPAQAQ